MTKLINQLFGAVIASMKAADTRPEEFAARVPNEVLDSTVEDILGELTLRDVLTIAAEARKMDDEDTAGGGQ